MRNLKKVLALALALAMTLTFFANAAFTDDKSIDADCKVAVDTLVALGVLAGDPDGSFRPEDGLTRAEAAKIIFTIRNKGNADASGFVGQPTKFADIANHWAKGYIVYCESLGIVSGKNPTTFAPEDKVTGSELAKMLLTGLGYKADIEGYTGASWELNVLSDATDAGLLDNYGTGYGVAAPRQWVALMTYNMLYSTCVKYDRDGNIQDEERTAIVGSEDIPVKVPMTGAYKFFGLIDYKGIVDAVDADALYVDGNKFEVNNAYMYLGKEVKVLYKVDADGEFSVYDAVVTAKNNVYEKTWNDVEVGEKDSSKIKFNDKEYALDGTADKEVLFSLNYADTSAKDSDFFTADNDYSALTLIDNDNDGKIEYAIKVAKTFGKIGTVSEDDFYFSKKADGAVVNGTYDFEDAETYEGLKKNDYVFAYENAALDKIIVEKAAMEEGKVRGMRGDSFNIAGTYYDIADAYTADAMEIGSTYEFYTDGKYVVFAEEVESETPTNFALIKSLDVTTSFGDNTWYARVLLNDGTSKDYELKDNKIDGNKLTGSSDNDIANYTRTYADKIYTYSISDGVIKLTALEEAGSLKLAENVNAMVDHDDDTIDGMFINDDAVVFVKYSDNSDGDYDYDVLTGKEVKAFDADFGTGKANMGYVEKNGMAYVQVGVLMANAPLPGEDGDTLFGMLTNKSWYEKDENDDYFEYYELWNGKETVTIKREMDDQNDYDNIAKKTAVSYTLKANGEVDAIDANLTVGSLVGFDLANDKVAIDVSSSVYTLDDDAVIIYVNRDDAKGVASAEVSKADKDDATGKYIPNIAYYVGNSGKILGLIYDIDNDWKN